MTHRPGWLPVAALLVLAACVQAWTMARAAVPAQDSVRFVAYAREAGRSGWGATMTDRNDAPGFPAVVGLVHAAIEGWAALISGELPPDIWARSVTWSAAILVVLTVLPLYALFARVFSPRIALLSVGLYAIVPTVARLGADGLSDSTHLFLVVSAVWAWIAAEDAGAWRVRFARWSAAGACLGLACLTRMEAVAMVPALLFATAWRDDGKPRASAGAALAMGLMVWLIPYTLTTGKVTPKHSVTFLSNLASTKPQAEERAATAAPSREAADELPRAFDPKDRSTSSRRYGYMASLEEFCRELPEGWGYVAGMLSLAGLCVAPRSGSQVFDRLVLAFLAIYLLSAIQFAAGAGYLASRHFLLPAVLTLGWAGVAIERLATWLERWIGVPSTQPRVHVFRGAVLGVLVLATLAPQFKPLRASRLAYRRAGEWLAETALAGETVLDTRQWTALYSGRATYGADASSEALADPQLSYLVVERAEIARDSQRARVLRTLIEHCGVEAARFASDGDDQSDSSSPTDVVVYAWQAPSREDRTAARPPRALRASHRAASRDTHSFPSAPHRR